MAKQKKSAKKRVSSASNKVKIAPIGDRVLVREALGDVQEKTISGIIIPATADKDSGSKRGKVVAVGAGHYDDGKLVPVSVKAGDTVLFQWGEKIVVDGEEYLLVRESDILAVINK